jgi:hypothetical protein
MSPVGAMICGALLVGIPIFLIGWQIVAILWGEQLTSLISEFESWFVQTIPFPRNTYLLALWVFGFFDSFRELRLDPFRPYFYLLGTFATCVVVFCPYWYPAARGVAAWKILNAGWLGLSCVALGLYQHLLLVRLMPQHGRDNDDES